MSDSSTLTTVFLILVFLGIVHLAKYVESIAMIITSTILFPVTYIGMFLYFGFKHNYWEGGLSDAVKVYKFMLKFMWYGEAKCSQ